MNANWQNKTVFTGDNLPIMRGMNSASVDLIYLDPPFNSNSDYAAPIGSKAAGAEFKDTWTLNDLDVAWLDLIETRHSKLNRVIQATMTNSDKSYLVYMAVRFIEMKRILKDTGSIYLHCDPTMSHYLKLVMDALFGRKRFRNEIIWSYQRWTGATKHFQRMHQILLFYAMSKNSTFNRLTEEYSTKSKHKGARYSELKEGVLKQRYTSDISRQKSMRDVWEISYLNSQAKERTGYPTQKPLAVLDRVVKASSNEGDVVFDPFCGCATTLIAAERLQRQWIGIDISPKAVELVNDRIIYDQGGEGPQEGMFEQVVARKDIPQRTDVQILTLYNSPVNKKHLYGQQEGNCNGCNQHFSIRNFEVDHIIARSQGGTDHIDNLQLLCGYCNRVKGNRGQEYLIAKLEGRQVAYA